jgi:hypothetical protein
VPIEVAKSVVAFTTAATMTSSPPKVDTRPTDVQIRPRVDISALPARWPKLPGSVALVFSTKL